MRPDSDLSQALSSFFSGGNRGVQLFFVLSGFILCLPFAHQYINNGKKVSLKRYYLRRVTRLEPPYFIIMIGLFLVMLVMKQHPVDLLVKSLLSSLIYAHNILLERAPYLTVVAWSLEIEIQFYVLAPMLFLLLKLEKTLRRTIISAICIGMVCFQHYYPASINTIYLHLQYFMAGILLADLYVSGDLLKTKKSLIATLVAISLFTAVLLLPFKTELWATAAYPFVVCGLYLLILRNDAVKKVFSYGYLPIIGGMCYSIYLIHYPLISFVGRFSLNLKLGNGFLTNLFLQMTLLTIAILLISSVFYILVERPFMSSKWTDKLMKKDKHDENINPVTVPDTKADSGDK